MIPAPPGLAARYKHQHKGKEPYWSRKRIIAFDDDLDPLVVSDDHRLEYASRYGNYDGITDLVDADIRPIDAIMPAGGWRIEFTENDGSKYDQPLVGWGLKGAAPVPLIWNGDFVDDMDRYRGEYRIYHPDEWDIPAGDTREEAPGEA